MQRSQALTLAVVALLVAPGLAAGVTNQHVVEGHPGISVSVPDNEVVPGERTALTVQLINNGNVTDGSVSQPQLEQRVTTARAVTARIEDTDAPVSVNTNEQSIGTLPDGASAPVQFAIAVDEDADPGRYRVPVNVTYNYTQSIDTRTSEYNTTQESKTFNVTLVVEERARFQVVSVDSNARVGATGTVAVTLRNAGTESAYNTSVALTSQNSDLTFGQSVTASRFVGGEWVPGETRTVQYRLRTSPTASEQSYAFSAQATFEDPDGLTFQSDSLSLGVTPQPEQQFTIVETGSTVRVDGTGTVNVTLRNDGPIDVRDASVTLTSQNSDVVFGQSATASRYVGTWAANETRTIQVDASALKNAEQRSYTIQAQVSYEDGEGDPGRSGALQFGVVPGPEQSFDAGEFSSTLRVGEEGNVTGTITNTGSETVTSVVVVFDSQKQNVNPLEREVSVGTLEPGESAEFTFSVEVTGAADAGPRQFTFHPEYRDAEGDQRRGDTFDGRFEVRPEQEDFDVDVRNATVERGATTLLEVTVTNTGDERYDDISAKLFADSPIDVEDSDAFIGELAPGESTTATFEISAGGGAIAKDYPVQMDFQYDTPDGDTLLSDTYRVPVSVTEAESGGGSGTSPVVVGAIVLAVLIAAGAAYRYFG